MRDSTATTHNDDHYTAAQTWACVRGFRVVLRGWPRIVPGALLFGTLPLLFFGESDPLRFLLVVGVTAVCGSVAVVSFVSRTHRVFGYKRVPKDQIVPPWLPLLGLVFVAPWFCLTLPPQGVKPEPILFMVLKLLVFDSLFLGLALVTANGGRLRHPETLSEDITTYKARRRDVMRKRAERRAAQARVRMSRYHPLDRLPGLAAYARRRMHVPAGPIRRFLRRLGGWPVALVLAVSSHPLDVLCTFAFTTMLTTFIWVVRTYDGMGQGQRWMMDWRPVIAGLVVAPFAMTAWATCHKPDVFPRSLVRPARGFRGPGAYAAGQVMATCGLVGLGVGNFALSASPVAASFCAAAGVLVGSLIAYDWWWSYHLPENTIPVAGKRPPPAAVDGDL